ncbi:conserved hypothetical protein [Aliarcobacter butzleri JV22]|uniref:hypothetical protein n=1 Tax=Aliarcobacter butzleri TaxID=28197 RepID=UPI0001F14C48|nr:hypothetical protein [Aliarcobacter butzleri]EFU70808.1 conserved hypothetical protein [Aliarcobacter butzleri JV22]
MKILIFAALLISFSFSSTVDEYLNSLKQEALKEDPNFKNFDAKRGEEIFTSKHIGKKVKRFHVHHVTVLI